jgi:restriction system protein
MVSKESPGGPKFVQYFGPLLQALRNLSGSARSAEAIDQVAADLSISDAERSDLLDSGQPRFDNGVAWARFYLAKAGYIDTTKRGVWTLTDKGREQKTLSHPQALAVFEDVQARVASARYQPQEAAPIEGKHAPGNQETSFATYRDELLAVLQALPPDGFERFCQHLLRESGFQEVAVTGRSGDGGIDGIGLLQVNPLVSFKVLFQCKRYKGTVVPAQVRDFRGAMMGRADKGIILTTGTFSADARKEAVRDGVPPIELVDGEKLLDMLEKLELGMTPVQAYVVDRDFFSDFGLASKGNAR